MKAGGRRHLRDKSHSSISGKKGKKKGFGTGTDKRKRRRARGEKTGDQTIHDVICWGLTCRFNLEKKKSKKGGTLKERWGMWKELRERNEAKKRVPY